MFFRAGVSQQQRLLSLHNEGRRCLALLMMDEVVMDRRWVTDRVPDGESEGCRVKWRKRRRRSVEEGPVFATRCCNVSLTSHDLTRLSRNTCSELAVSVAY